MPENRPNIIIVMADQQRADLRKSCGYELDTMPFLDSWAQGGVDFDRAYTPNPTCMPARVSMYTGRYCESHNVRTNHNAQDALYTEDLLDVLRANGYATALCGKNHSHHALEDFDFAETCGHLGYEGEVNTTEEEIGFADFLLGTRHMEVNYPSPYGVEVQHPYRNVSSAFKFIDELNGEKPFFAWVSFAEPHNPYQVPEPYFDMFPPESLPKTHAEESGKDIAEILHSRGERYEWVSKVWHDVIPEEYEKRVLRCRSNYHGMLRLIDDQFKRLIEGLEERGLDQNTIVVYMADHGDFVGEYGLIRKGTDLPDILTRIPMAWRGPGIEARGKDETHFVNIVDMLPTFCDILGVDVPFGVQGKSIRSLLENENIPEEEFEVGYSESGFSGLYWEDQDALTTLAEGATGHDMVTFDCLNTWTQCGQVRAVWKGDYHAQMDMMGTGHLYNLATDRFEMDDLWNKPGYEAVQKEMTELLVSSMLKAADPLPAPHWRYRTKVHPKGYWNQKDYAAPDPGVRDLEAIGNH